MGLKIGLHFRKGKIIFVLFKFQSLIGINETHVEIEIKVF